MQVAEAPEGKDAVATGTAIIDAHSDVSIDLTRRRQRGERRVLENVFLPRWREGGVSAAFITVGGDSPSLCPAGYHFPLESAILMTQTLLDDIQESRDIFRVATAPGEIASLHAEGLFPIVLHMEGCRPFEHDFHSSLHLWYLMGLRSVALTWNVRNLFADGANEVRAQGGLTNAGVALVKEIGELGMVLDLAHITKRGFWDVMETHEGPVVVSHAGSQAVHNHDRNIDDDQVRALAQTGGLLGLTFFPAMVGEGDVTAEDVGRHFAHVAELVGTEHIAIGPDFMDYAADIVTPNLKKQAVGYHSLNYPPELQTTADFKNVIPILRHVGFSDTDVRRVLWENSLRVFDASLARRA